MGSSAKVQIHRIQRPKGREHPFVVLYEDLASEACRKLSQNGLRLYLYYLFNKNGYEKYLSIEDIKEWTGISKPADAFRNLEQFGYIVSKEGKDYDFYELPQDVLTLDAVQQMTERQKQAVYDSLGNKPYLQLTPQEKEIIKILEKEEKTEKNELESAALSNNLEEEEEYTYSPIKPAGFPQVKIDYKKMYSRLLDYTKDFDDRKWRLGQIGICVDAKLNQDKVEDSYLVPAMEQEITDNAGDPDEETYVIRTDFDDFNKKLKEWGVDKPRDRYTVLARLVEFYEPPSSSWY